MIKNKRGFTLIELLVVIAMIGTMAAITTLKGQRSYSMNNVKRGAFLTISMMKLAKQLSKTEQSNTMFIAYNYPSSGSNWKFTEIGILIYKNAFDPASGDGATIYASPFSKYYASKYHRRLPSDVYMETSNTIGIGEGSAKFKNIVNDFSSTSGTASSGPWRVFFTYGGISGKRAFFHIKSKSGSSPLEYTAYNGSVNEGCPVLVPTHYDGT